jgi:hypothetical protein
MTITQIKEQIFEVNENRFLKLALAIFNYQYENTTIYRQYIDAIGVHPKMVDSIEKIPFLPIQFFKTHQVISKLASNESIVFESSGTTGQIPSKHPIVDIDLYKKSFELGFSKFFGDIKQYCILGLLPSYLERGQSSLVFMVNHLIDDSGHELSGFYLHDHEALHETLLQLEAIHQPVLLFGVTYALLDFAEKYPIKLHSTQIIETGGMKGRREELIRDEVHSILKKAFSIDNVYSEYGMTELLSQAYSKSDGIFETPAWMKILIRDINDPFSISTSGKGLINIIDFANLHSCSFIATDDMGELFENGLFCVNGRLDHSELRGCSMLSL